MKKLRLFLAWICFFCGTACAAEIHDLIPVMVHPVQIDGAAIGAVRLIGMDRLSSPPPWFGGWSGMAWDGEDLVFLSDRGTWARNRVELDRSGRPLRMSITAFGVLDEADGDKKRSDSEELVRMPDGWLASFERDHRLRAYVADFSGKAIVVAAPLEMSGLDENAGIEAALRLEDGRLLLISEGDEDDASSPAWIGQGRQWRRLDYPHEGLFRPTGAVLLPGGDVLVVERRYTLLGGAAMRLVQINRKGLENGRFDSIELARIEPPFPVDNFESVAIRRNAAGGLVAYVLSDDNFNPLQSTLLLTLQLP